MIRNQVAAGDFGSGLKGALDPDTLDQLSTELIRWQICLAVLSIGFIGYTALVWKQVIENGDSRYVIEGFFAHAFWVISAVLMAMPFWAIWRAWRLARIRALGELIQMPASEATNLEARISALRALRPVGAWNVAAFVATVASSLAAPAIQLIFKLAHVA